MYKLIITTVLVAASTVALAQPGKGKHGPIMEQLDLTDSQRQEMREIRESGGGRDEIHAVLTEEQQAQLEVLKAERGGKGQRRAKHAQRLADDLNLTDAQSEEIRSIIESGGSRDEVRAVLTEEQRQSFDELRAQRGKHPDKHRDKHRGEREDRS